ncbi:ABC transporter substrate-binding protein [Pseudothermotoga thermarum]|uniref:Periplasmic binding protein n=1 Tax=Pseudothermotoga thermarum DSM 5069 TaxID=688269 RepID=F7YYN5_9THEM|nr:ABC transporter substrate-binding protein [Pseudothermotoga thermarum]AEH51067.1 periplasmic binding protein [Pseudothermotoga thermarum DSM 5069]
MRRFSVWLVLLVAVSVLLAYPITVVDDAGRVVTIEKMPMRIICAAPSATMFLQYLGLEDRIVGVTNWDEYQNAEKIGNMVPLNVEKILSLNPDLVITYGGFQLPEVAKLEQHNLTTIVLNATTVKGILQNLVLVGTVCGVREKAKQLALELEKFYTDIAKKAYAITLEKRVKVVYLLDVPGPDIKEIWTCGTGSFLHEIITLAGGINIAAGYTGPNGWLPISIEFIVSQDPDVIVVAGYIPGAEEEIKQKILNFAPFKSIKAVKNRRVYVYDGNLLSRAVPQLIQMIEVMYKDFYGGK